MLMQGAILAANSFQGEGRLFPFEVQGDQGNTSLHAVPCQPPGTDSSAWASSMHNEPSCSILMGGMCFLHLLLYPNPL